MCGTWRSPSRCLTSLFKFVMSLESPNQQPENTSEKTSSLDKMTDEELGHTEETRKKLRDTISALREIIKKGQEPEKETRNIREELARKDIDNGDKPDWDEIH